MTDRKNSLATAAVGDDHSHILESTRAYFELFARRTGAEFVVIDNCHYETGKYAKLAIGSLLEEYQRVLFVDVDALILPGCPELFADFRDPRPVYAWVEPVDWWPSFLWTNVDDVVGLISFRVTGISQKLYIKANKMAGENPTPILRHVRISGTGNAVSTANGDRQPLVGPTTPDLSPGKLEGNQCRCADHDRRDNAERQQHIQ